MNKEANQPAFPGYPGQPNGLTGEEYQLNFGSSGLTKREYFAAMALKGMLSNNKFVDQLGCQYAIVKEAVNYADELLTQLNPQP